MKRIYLPKYLVSLLPLFNGTLIDKNYFAFRLYDGDNDDLLQSKDISDILTNVLVCPIGPNDVKVCTCPLFTEIHTFYDYYVKNNLLTYKVKKLEIDFPFFMNNVPGIISCLIHDFTDKLTLQNEMPSIFSHDAKDLEKTMQLYE